MNSTCQTVLIAGLASVIAFPLLNDVVQNEPAESCDPITLGFYASIGIEKGKPFAPDARMKKILHETAAVGDATARTLTYQSRIPEAFYYPNRRFGGCLFRSQGAGRQGEQLDPDHPGKGWNMLFRLYGPLEPWFSKTWKLNQIEEVK